MFASARLVLCCIGATDYLVSYALQPIVWLACTLTASGRAKAYVTPLCAGSLGAGHSWQAEQRTRGKVYGRRLHSHYPQEGNLDAKFGIGTVSAWFTL